MANEIPRHKRTEAFSLYLRCLQEFFARERLAARTYNESEALDLAVRNLSSKWRSKLRCLVKRDVRSGNQGLLPLKLALLQIAITLRSRTVPTSTPRTMRSLQVDGQTNASPCDVPTDLPPSATDSGDSSDLDYRQHAIKVMDEGQQVEDLFDSCFDPVNIHSVELLGVDFCEPVSAKTVPILPEPQAESLIL
jgi:hypothetical protein